MGLFDATELNRVLPTLARVAAGAGAALVATGVPLMVAYDPDGPGWLSGLHSLASALFLGCAVAAAACVAGAAVQRSRTWLGWRLALAGVVVAVGGMASGQLLRWTSVRPPDPDARGVFAPLSGAVDAVDVGGAELGKGTFLAWALVHLVVVTAAGAAVGWFVRRRHRAWASQAGADTPAEPPAG